MANEFKFKVVTSTGETEWMTAGTADLDEAKEFGKRYITDITQGDPDNYDVTEAVNDDVTELTFTKRESIGTKGANAVSIVNVTSEKTDYPSPYETDEDNQKFLESIITSVLGDSPVNFTIEMDEDGVLTATKKAAFGTKGANSVSIVNVTSEKTDYPSPYETEEDNKNFLESIITSVLGDSPVNFTIEMDEEGVLTATKKAAFGTKGHK